MSLKERLIKSSTLDGVSVLSKSEVFNNQDNIKTPIPGLNIAYSGSPNGGMTSDIHIFAGPSKHFKTMYALISASSYLKKYEDSVLIFYDNEFGSPPEYFKSVGIPEDRVIHKPFTTLEGLREDITNTLEEIKRGDKVIIIIDSLGMAASGKEYQDALDGSDKADMTRAKLNKSIFRIITPHVRLKDFPLIVIQHTYEEMTMHPRQIVSGGCVDGDTEIIMSDGTLKKMIDVNVGDIVKTQDGNYKVTNTWNPETLEFGTPECYEIEFEDGYKVICSDQHPFKINNKWVDAEDLNIGDDVEILKAE